MPEIDPDFDPAVARRIKALLALRGETTTDLAGRLGISQPSVSYRLTGRRSFSGKCSLKNIADALGVAKPTLTSTWSWPRVALLDAKATSP